MQITRPLTPPLAKHAQVLDSVDSLNDAFQQVQLNRLVSPPTPAASPQPGLTSAVWPTQPYLDAEAFTNYAVLNFVQLAPHEKSQFLSTLLPLLSYTDLQHTLNIVTPLLKRDFLTLLPAELGLHVLSFVEDPRDLMRASRVCKSWRKLVLDESTWKHLLLAKRFPSAAISIKKSAAGLPGVLPMSRVSSLTLPTGRSRDAQPRTTRSASMNAISSTSTASTSAISNDTPAMDARQVEQWALQGLGLLRQTPNIAPLVPNPTLSPFGIRGPLPPLPSFNDMGSPTRALGFVLPSIESPSPIRPRLVARQFSIEMPSAPVLPQISDSPVETRQTSDLTSNQETPRLQEDVPLPQEVRGLLDTASISPRRLRPRSLPLPSLIRPTTTINFSPAPPFQAPTDSSWIRTPLQLSISQSSTFQQSSESDDDSPQAIYSTNPFGLSTVIPSRAASTQPELPTHFSYQNEFKRAYMTEANWLKGPGRILSTQQATDDGVVTSLCLDEEYIVVGMATNEVHLFDAVTGAYVRTLHGHTLGVWCVVLVSRTDKKSSTHNSKSYQASAMTVTGSSGPSSATRSSFDPAASPVTPSRPRNYKRPSSFGSSRDFHSAGWQLPGASTSDFLAQQGSICGNAKGWGQTNAVIVSGGCDRLICVWDASTGECRFAMEGHTSTIRCLKVLDGQPIAISGSRDTTIRIWDIAKGRTIRVLEGHTNSVRCLEVSGNRLVSGSYDNTCRLWDIETGECQFVFRGHLHQIYAVAFDGQRVATGSLDSTVRIWSAKTGDCLALLQGHTSLVGQLQLTDSVLVTGGSDGRVIVFSLATLECLHRLCAHDNSVTCLQFDDRFIVTGGNDGRVKLFDFKTGQFIRELAEPCEAVWRIMFREDKCVILCKRQGKTTMSLVSFRPEEDEM